MHELGDIQEHGSSTLRERMERFYRSLFRAGVAGYRVGRYSSRRQLIRWKCGGPDLSPAELRRRGYHGTGEVCIRRIEKGMEHPTIFEVETEMAFLYFYQKM